MMLRKIVLLMALLAVGLPSLNAADDTVRWMTLPNAQMEVNGLPWYAENKGELSRLPASLKDTFPPAVWNLAQSPSGARIRFSTDSTTLAIRLEYPHPPDMKNMHAFGQSGVDLYLNGAYTGTAVADKEAKPGKTYEHVYFNFSGRPRVFREVVIYLPLYMPVRILGIGVDREARFRAARRFALAKPVVFYGTSTTQGGCASRPGMSYQALLGRALNIDFVNLGFSGAGKGQPAVATAVASLDAACFVLDFAGNNPNLESLTQVYAPFVETVRKQHPDTPIVAVTPTF
jgi:hypothetical protein